MSVQARIHTSWIRMPVQFIVAFVGNDGGVTERKDYYVNCINEEIVGEWCTFRTSDSPLES